VVLVDGSEDFSGAPDMVGVADVDLSASLDVVQSGCGAGYVRLRL